MPERNATTVAAFSTEHHSQTGGPGALAALVLAAVAAVIVFLPPEGRIAAPLHAAVWALLGQASFMLPVGLAFVGLVSIVNTLRPNVPLPRRRLAGMGLIAAGLLPIEHLLSNGGEGTGLVGRWLSSTLLELLAGPGTLLVLVAVLGLGIWLAFDLRLPRARKRADAEG
jgi:DNA translocase FtsK/SpoIIIE-like protein